MQLGKDFHFPQHFLPTLPCSPSTHDQDILPVSSKTKLAAPVAVDDTAMIGIFDSGLGGLTVVRAVREVLPSENIVYFGDVARLPYGIKSTDQIVECSKHNTEFLMNRRIKALVVACNSSASASLGILQN